MSNIYWSDFHTNMHSEHLNEIESWYEFAREMLDFWAPVYYPYYINSNSKGFKYEDTLNSEKYNEDWGKIKKFCESKDDKFILYMGYEWQGNGRDGDHNVFYKDLNGKMLMPLTYEELCEGLKDKNAIAIPHHTGYKSGHRGKNWCTNKEDISPVAEIYSSHGCSESSDSAIPLNVHIHMGPRGEEGTILYAIKQGIKVGIMASGDNHVCPAISGNGFMAVISEEYSRDGLFNAIINRHTYGVTRSKIILDYKVNEAIMGSVIESRKSNSVAINVRGTSAIDRVELIHNGIAEKTFVHNGTWEEEKLEGKVRFKFEIEFGWGPDRRLFPEIEEKIWSFKLFTKGNILNVEKLWTSPGSKISIFDNRKVEAEILTRKTVQGNGKLSQKNYLTPNIQNQSLIFEIEDYVNNSITFIIDGKRYEIPIKRILAQTIVEALEEEACRLLKDSYQFTEYYREDPWWHNAYKFVIHKGYPSNAYEVSYKYELTNIKSQEDSIFIKVTQKNGDTAWSSPIWIKKGE